MLNALIHFVNTIVPLPKDEENKLLAIARPANIHKGDAFIKEGSIPTKFAFLADGLFRYYYTTKKGSEFTKGFFPGNTFVSSYSAMVKGIPSSYTVEALEDSNIAVIEYNQWKQLYEGHSCWSTLLIAILEKGFFKKEKREKEFLLLSAKERYESFLEEYPELEGRIKQTLVASYLGITPVALSRIRSETVQRPSN